MPKKLDEILKGKKAGAQDAGKSKKLAAIQAAVAAMQKKFGTESVNYLGNKRPEPLPRFSSGSIALDKILGGGYPEGRMIEVVGEASTGKTTLCYHALAECQRKYPDDWCGFVDSEQSFDPQYAEAVGVNVGELVTAQPDTGTDAFGMVQGMIEAGAKLIVVDSVAAMMPKEEAEEEDYAHNSVGAQARMMSKGLRKLTAIAGKNKCTLMFTNQLRTKIGVLYGDPSVAAGGKALGYYASVIMRLSSGGKVKATIDGEEQVTAIETHVTTAKNKTAAPFRKCTLVIEFGKGIDNDAGVIDIAIGAGFIQKKGGWYAIDGKNIAQGMIKLKEYLEQNPVIYAEIKAKTEEFIRNEKADEAVSEQQVDAEAMTDDEIAAAAMRDDDAAEEGEV